VANRQTGFLTALAILALAPVANIHAQSLAAERTALLAADRKLGSSGNAPDAVSAISAQFADSISFISLGQIFRGVPAAREALSRNPDNVKGTVTWAPIQGDVSADGKVGYTLGYLTLKAPDGKETPGKYVSYWIKEKGVWRVLVYKRAGRAPGALPGEEAAPVKPAMKAAQNTATDSSRFAQELDRAERNFSDEAGKIGLGPAFTKNSADDAHHVGGPNDAQFRRGPAEIGAGVAAGGEPPLGSITWVPDVVYVANSGDLGITFGYISIAAAGGAPARKVSYLTVWKRNSITDKWKLAVE
jgi:ketosteroid isomerase-like protein